MELKEYLKIFKKNAKLFVGIIIVIILGSFIYFSWQPVSYNTSLTLNITRSGSQTSNDYRYDDFYRLQADEKFAETIVQWLKSPRFASDIYQEAGLSTARLNLGKLAKIFRAEKLSSQVVSVTFSTNNPEAAKKISDAIYRVITKNTDALDIEQRETSWFRIVASEPITILSQTGSLVIFIVSFLVGFFIAFWVILIMHYLE